MSGPSFAEYSWEAMVVAADPNHYVHDEEVYEFSNGRRFLIDDHTQGGVYADDTEAQEGSLTIAGSELIIDGESLAID